MASKIGSLYAQLGFRVDNRKLREFEKSLKNTHRRLENSADRWKKNVQQNTKTQIAGINAVEKRLHKQRGQLWQIRNDYKRVNSEFHRGNLSIERRNRLLNDLNRAYRTQKGLVSDLNRQQRATPVGRLQQARDSFRGRRGGAATGAAAGGAVGAGAAGGVAQGLAVAGAVTFGLSEVFQMQQGLIKTLTALEGSRENGLKKYQEIENLANREGQKLTEAIDAYKQTLASFSGTAFEDMSLELSQNITKFKEIRAFDREEFLRLQDILGDMASSESVNSELVKRLNLLQISTADMASMMGFDNISAFKKAIEQGEVETEKFIKSFNDYMFATTEAGSAMDRFRRSSQAESNRLLNQALDSTVLLNQAGLDKWVSSVYEGMREALGKAEIFFEEVGKGFGQLAEPAKESLVAFGELLGSIGRLTASLDSDDPEKDLLKFADILNGVAAFIDRATKWLEEFDAADSEFKMLDESLERWWGDLIQAILDRTKEGILASMPFMSDPNASHEERVKQSQENIKRMKDSAERMDVSNLPPTHPRYRADSGGNTTITQNISPTIHIDGSDPNAIIGTLEDHLTNMMRQAAISDQNTEK